MKHGKEHFKNHRFPGQKTGEHIQLVVRKHWIIDVKIAAVLFVIAIVPFLIVVGAEIFAWDGGLNDTMLTVALGFILYFLLVLLIGYVKWLNEELDIIVATDSRIISHEQVDMFHRSVSEANLGQMQDVTGSQKGFLQSVLHYGNIEIQTSAADLFFVIKNVSHPYENARALLDLRDKLTPHND